MGLRHEQTEEAELAELRECLERDGRLAIDPRKVLTVFPEFGNVGPASVPIALSKLKEMGRLEKGKRVALLGIGSGLNCSMAEVVW